MRETKLKNTYFYYGRLKVRARLYTDFDILEIADVGVEEGSYS